MLIDNIYVINLDRSHERLNNIKKLFDQHNLKFTRFSAVDGKKLTESETNEITNVLCRHLLCTKSIIGCARSHFLLWKKLVDDPNNNSYVILEDDATFDENFSQIIKKLENIDLDYDIVSLHCKFSSFACHPTHVVGYVDDQYMIGTPMFPISTTAYVISKKGAEKLLKLFNEQIVYHIDFQIAITRIFKNINYYAIYPNLVNSNDIESTISNYESHSIFINILKIFRLNLAIFLFNTPLLTFNMNFTITIYEAILIILILLSFFVWKIYILGIILLCELILCYI